ncbi:MAG: D-2-hydroxyacid dehydrogenase [Eubacteriales bacterium]|nr:D-2-hydroxyacid dehydrogenase [Eubacteriales bacterium]
MKIVVLDGYCANPGDLSWEAIGAMGELSVYDRTAPEDVISRAQGAQILYTNKTVLNAETLRQLPECRFIGVLATGFNIVDTKAAKEQGVVVCNVPAYSTDSVAQLTFALLLELCHRVGAHTDDIHSGGWKRSPDFSYSLFPSMELAGKTFGVVGYGAIGRKVGAVAQALGMRVIQCSRSPKQTEPGVESVSFEELLRRADVVSLHCPFTGENADMINEQTLAQMKKTAFLINTGRGQLIDEAALRRALDEGVIAGAGVDVLVKEPMAADCPLCGAKNLVATPHIAWATPEARARLMNISASNLRAFLDGAPVNVVNP